MYSPLAPGSADLPDHRKISALLVGDFTPDRPLVTRVFLSLGWALFEARGRNEAIECLERNSIQVVVLQDKSSDWDWRTALQHLRAGSKPAQLIVASQHADASLWSEVLNAGGYDVLVQPLDRHELTRVLASAHRNRADEAAVSARAFK